MAVRMHTSSTPSSNPQNHRRAVPAPRLEQRVAQLERYLAIQHIITHIIAGASSLDAAMSDILAAICEATGWDFGEVWHLDRSDNLLHCIATWCSPACQFPAFEASGRGMTFAAGRGLPGRVLSGSKTRWIASLVNDTNFLRAELARQDGLRGGLGIPVRIEGAVIGALTFFTRHPQQPDRAMLQMLETVGSQIGLFIERKRAEQAEREQAQRLAALEERARLARDLHDSVTQSLFSASVIAEMLPLIWQRDPDQAKSGLDELHQLTHDALAEMRALLVELRPAPSNTLAQRLEHLADKLRRRARLDIVMDIHIDCPLSEAEQVNLQHITQEALHNITKHAAASQVSVRLIASPQRLELQIADDGRGFDLAGTPAGHFGLEIMQERAGAIGAAFYIHSVPGKGTRLSLIRTGSAATATK